eukprot:TRINITY_DN6929_c0_g1_i1.p1 TRINITY_DN6929_c0_g1~~TRINITY_DN6929_c0_g1_i1.p1  ORF type:complete len:424 (-),score=54.46 TRINITY_DN6929_c0_g1_i1:87-1358(-)
MSAKKPSKRQETAPKQLIQRDKWLAGRHEEKRRSESRPDSSPQLQPVSSQAQISTRVPARPYSSDPPAPSIHRLARSERISHRSQSHSQSQSDLHPQSHSQSHYQSPYSQSHQHSSQPHSNPYSQTNPYAQQAPSHAYYQHTQPNPYTQANPYPQQHQSNPYSQPNQPNPYAQPNPYNQPHPPNAYSQAAYAPSHTISPSSSDPRRQEEELPTHHCSVCYEIMSGHKVPTILVPCGHTFCRVCLERSTKSVCPLCRSPISGTVVNVALQQMIAELVQKDNQESKARRPAPQPSNPPEENLSEKYLSDFRLHSMRCRVLQQEYVEQTTLLSSSQHQLTSVEQMLSHLQQEKSRLERELQQVNNQLQLYTQQEEQLRTTKQEAGEKVQWLRDTLLPLRIDRDKSRFMLKSLAPALELSDDEDLEI